MNSGFQNFISKRWHKLPVSLLVAAAVISFGWLEAKQQPELVRSLEGHKGGIHTLQFSPDGTHLLSAGEDGKVYNWDLLSGKEGRRLSKNRRGMFETAFTPDGLNIITTGKKGAVEVINVDGKRTTILKGPEVDQNAVAISPDGVYIASAGIDHTITVWMRLGEEPVHVLKDCTSPITDMAFNGTSQIMAVSCLDGTLRIYDIAAGYLTRTMDLRVPVSAISFNPKDDQIAAAAGEEIKIIDLDNLDAIKTIRGHKGQVISLAYSPNGLFLASGSTDKTARLWSVTTGRELATLVQQDGQISAVAFGPLGRTVATASKPYQQEVGNSEVGEQYVAVYDIGNVYSDSQISNYVEKEMYHWQKKGEFEKVQDFQARLRSKPQQAGALFTAVFKKFAQEVAEEAVVSAYNAEKEEYTVTLPALGSFVLNVPISKAQAFKKDFHKAIFRNFIVVPNIVVPEKSTWKLKALEVYLPTDKESFHYGDVQRR